jgi:hypothetical protein
LFWLNPQTLLISYLESDPFNGNDVTILVFLSEVLHGDGRQCVRECQMKTVFREGACVYGKWCWWQLSRSELHSQCSSSDVIDVDGLLPHFAFLPLVNIHCSFNV